MRRILRQLYHQTAGRMHRLAATRDGAPFTYVALGDSTVEGIGASKPTRTYAYTIYTHVKLRFKRAAYFNFGKGGARVNDVLVHQLQPAISAKPDLVTISIGANDILHRTRLSAFRRRLTTLIEALQGETQAVIVISNVPNFSVLRAIPRPLKPLAKLRILRINRVIQDVATTHDLLLIDTYKQSTVFAKQFPEAVFTDNFHPSDFGYALWANTIVTAIEHKLPLLKPAR